MKVPGVFTGIHLYERAIHLYKKVCLFRNLNAKIDAFPFQKKKEHIPEQRIFCCMMFWVRIELQVWLLINYLIVWLIDFGIGFVFLAAVCCFSCFYLEIVATLKQRHYLVSHLVFSLFIYILSLHLTMTALVALYAVINSAFTKCALKLNSISSPPPSTNVAFICAI